MSRRHIFIIGAFGFVALLVVAAWVWSLRPDSGSDAPLSAPVAETFLVRYDGLSFQPQNIKVRVGTKVFFVNESKQQRPMYIASDEHPTHENYPGFDAAAVNRKFPAMSESFSFVFDRTGTWGYHDHNYPSARGTIIIEEE